MTTIAEIFRRTRERLARNQDMPGNNSLIHFDGLRVREDIYDGNASVAQVGDSRGPWKAVVHLRLRIECTAPSLDEALEDLERIVSEWANGNCELTDSTGAVVYLGDNL